MIEFRAILNTSRELRTLVTELSEVIRLLRNDRRLTLSGKVANFAQFSKNNLLVTSLRRGSIRKTSKAKKQFKLTVEKRKIEDFATLLYPSQTQQRQ